MQAAVLTNDVKFAKANALKLCELGMCSEFFIKHPELTIKGALTDELLQSCKSKSSFNDYFRGSLYKMMEEDQLIHRNPETYHLRRKVDSSNIEEFKGLLQRFGFPSESRIGINCTQSLRGIQKPFYNKLLSHFFGQNFTRIHDLNKQWLDSNFISPRHYFRLNALSNTGRIIAGGEILKLNENYYIELPKGSGIKQMNKIRRKKGLWPISEEIQILRNHLAGKNDIFLIDLNVVHLPEEVPVQMLEKHCLQVY